MIPNPALGVVLHAIGGLMSAIFYLPYRKVKHWSWESYWIVGGVSFGLTVRYLGFALGTAMALGYCAVFGTLLPPIVAGAFGGVIKTTSGLVVMGGVVICVLGISVSG